MVEEGIPRKALKTLESERRVPPALRLLRLEAEDGSAFAAKISPLMLVETHEQRQGRHRGICSCAIERFFKGEGHPLVKFVIESAYGHVAARPRTTGRDFCEVTSVGLVGAVQGVERPTSVAPVRIEPKPARYGK